MYNYRILLLLTFAFFASCNSSKKATNKEVSPYTFDFINAETLSDAIEAADENDKLVFLDIYTDWCLPCKVMDEEVFTNKKLGEYFNSHFVSYKVNAEIGTGSMIADLYDVNGFPTLLFLDLNGRILVKNQGSVDYREMYDLADEALALNTETGE